MFDFTLQDGGYEFQCPSCRAPMPWIVVRHILSSMMSDKELKQSLDIINENYVRGQPEIRQCSECGTNQRRDFTKRWDDDRSKVACDECSRKEGHVMFFCWHCRQPWRPGFKGCGNDKCDGAAAKLKELQHCTLKTIASVSGCPNTRACPKCGKLIYHVDYCKHMLCTCGCNFCFVCLKLQNADKTWSCGGAWDNFAVAPRQTYIPDQTRAAAAASTD